RFIISRYISSQFLFLSFLIHCKSISHFEFLPLFSAHETRTRSYFSRLSFSPTVRICQQQRGQHVALRFGPRRFRRNEKRRRRRRHSRSDISAFATRLAIF